MNIFSIGNSIRSRIATVLTPRFSRLDSLSIVSRQSDLRTYSAESSCETFSVGQSSPLAFPFKAKSQLAFSHQSVLPIFLLCLTLFIGVGNAWGDDATVTLDFEGSVGSWPYNSEWECDGSSSATNHTDGGSRSAGFGVNGSAYITYKNALTNIKCVTLYMNRTTNNTNQPTITIQKSTWNGSAWSDWTDITGASQTFSLSKNTWTPKVFDFSSYKYNGKIRIKYTNNTTAVKLIDDIVVTYEETSCDKKVTISAGTPETGGSFSLDKTNEQKTCDDLTVTVSNIIAPDGKKFAAITQSGINSGVTINQNAKTVTYAANTTGTSTINVTFEDKGCSDKGASSITSIADGNSYTYGPVDEYFKYSTRQILYTKNDLGLSAVTKKGTIKSVYFYYKHTTAMSKKTSVKIYMANTSLTSLSASNYVPYSEFTEVYSGSLNCTETNSWNEFTLDTPFEYNGVGSLVLMIDDNSNAYDGNSYTFYYHSATGAQIYKKSDTENEDPSTTDWTTYTAENNRPSTKFCIQESDMTPATVTLKDNDEILTEVSAGAGVTLPSRADCDGYTFAGWTKSWTSAQSSWTTTAPTIIPAGNYIPTADENLYPVYTKTEGGGGVSWVLSSTAPTVGDSIIIAYYTGAAYKYMKNSGCDNDVLTVSSNIATPVANAKFKVVAGASNGVSFQSGTNYMHLNSSALNVTSTQVNSDISIFAGSSTNSFIIKRHSSATTYDRVLRWTGSNWTSSATMGDACDIYFFKRSTSTTSYISVPDCCTPLGQINGAVNTTQSGNSVTVKDWTYTKGSGAAESNIATYDVYLYSNANSYAAPVQTKTCLYSAKETGVTFTGLSYSATYKVKIGATAASGYCDITPVQVTTINSASTETFTLACEDAGLAYNTTAIEKIFGAEAFTNTLTNSHSVDVTYSSSVPAVATVDANGQVTIIKAGSTTITATSAEQTKSSVKYCADNASYTLTVNKADISPSLSYDESTITEGATSSTPSISGNTGDGAVTYAVTAATPAGCVIVNESTGVVTANAAGTATITATIAATDNYNGNTATANFTIETASYFVNGATLFIEAGKDGSAWDADACVKAWFRDGDSGGEAVATQWLANSNDGKKIFASVIPAEGNYRYMTIQRFASNCNDKWNDNGAVSKADDGGSNVVKTICSGNECVSWSISALNLYLRSDIDNWTENLATLSDQGAGVWTAAISNYEATAVSREFRITDSYNNLHGEGNTTLSGMLIGSTYDITASYNVKNGVLTMSKTFVQGTVSFNLQDHGIGISPLTDVAAGSKISAPSAPSAQGWTFGGWYKESTCENAWDFANDVVNESMTLYAKWSKQNYSITKTFTGCTASLMPDEYEYTGNGSDFTYTITADTKYVLPATITVTMGGAALAVNTDYTWNSTNGQLAISKIITGNLEITVTANRLYTVTLKDQNNELTQTIVGGNVVLPTRKSCTGYTFAGWSTTYNADWNTTAPTIIPAGNYGPTGDVDLYPVYTKTEETPGTPTTITLTNNQIKNGRNNSNNYSATYDIEGWTGKYAVSLNSNNYALQIGRNTSSGSGAYNSHLTTPSVPGGITSITITPHTYSGLTTAESRTFYLMDVDDLNYTAASNQTGTYGSGACASANGEVTISVTGAPSQFHIYADGTAYIYSVSLTYVTGGSSTTSYISVSDCCDDPELAYSTGAVAKTFGDSKFTNALTNSHSVAVTYGSSAESVATVDANGEVTIVGAGSAMITATASAQTISAVKYCADEASYTLTVSKANITPTLTYSSTTLTYGGSVSATPTVGGNPGNGGVTYSSSNISVATVDENTGVVTPVAAGSATITATIAAATNYNGNTATADFIVNKADITPTLAYTSTSLYVGDVSSSPTVDGNAGNGTVTYAVTTAEPAGCVTVNASTGVVTAVAAGTATITATIGATTNYNGNTAIANFTVTAASYFPRGKTVFIQAESTSAWTGDGCVKAWFHTANGTEPAQTTYWLFDATDGDAGKKLFAAIAPATGDLPYLDIQRFAANCNDWWNKNGGCSYADANGSNAIRSTGKHDGDSEGNYIAWNTSGITLELFGDPNSFSGEALATFADQGAGVWTATYENYAPADENGESQNFKIKTNYNGWIGNGGDNENATLDGMKVGSTYNVTATLDITDHSLVMSKTFVKGTVSFDMQGHGDAIAALTNVAANSKISAPSAPSDDAYNFGGWYKESTCENAWDFDNDVVNESMTLYAKWTLKTYAINYLAGENGTGTVAAGTKNHGEDYTLSSSTFSRDHYTQDGWSTEDGGAKAYNLGATYTTNAALTLYPHWAADTYTITWKVGGIALEGAALDGVSTSVAYGGKVTDFPSVDDDAIESTCGANKFMGWSLGQLRGTGHEAPTDMFSDEEHAPVVSGNVTYHAVFATQSGGGSTEVTDELTASNLAATSNTYTNFTNVQGANSNAVYAGQTSLNSGMGLRGTNPAGIVSSTSGGKIKSVVINWGSNATAGRTIDVYGKNSAYETAADLYSNTTAGTQAGSITYTNSTNYATTYNFTNDYDYVGIRMHSSATVIASVSFTWTSTTPIVYENYITGCCTDPATALSITNNNQVALDKTLTLASAGGNGGAITWSVVAGTGSATISDGVLTPSSEGTITLKAHQEENTVLGTTYCDQDAEITVTILPETVNVTGVTVDPTTKAILVGETFTITPTVTPNDATDKTVSWTSNATDKATVTNAGVVEGIAAGSATITCTTTDGGKTATTAVTVYSVTVLMQDEDENDISTSGVSASVNGRTLTATEGETNYKFKTWKFSTANGMTLNGSALEGTPTGDVTVIAEFYKPRVIKWSKNGNANFYESTTKYDSKPSDIPAITSGLSCAGTFIAWTDATHNNGQTAKDDASYYEGALYSESNDFSNITAEETTFYAVFAEGGAAPVNTVMWSEDWTGITESKKPSEYDVTGKTVYNSANVTYTESGSDCNVKPSDSYAGGTAPELYVKASNWWKISGIPTAGAATLTLSYKSNGSLPVTTTTANVTIDERTGSSNSYSHTITIGDNVSSFDLQFGTTNANTRLDNLSVKVASVNLGNYVTECNPNEISVTYDANGGSMSLACANGSHDKTTPYTICADEPTRNYYSFAGWSDGTNTYEAGATIPAADIDGDITLTAQWTPVIYNITYNLNGGEGAENRTYTIEDEEIVLPVPTKGNERFDGWFDNGSFTGSAITSVAAGSHGNKEFYANWATRHEIVFDVNGVTTTIYRASDENLEDAVAGQGSKPANPAAPGLCGATKEFVGWTENLIDGNTDTRPADLTDATGTVSANKHYYAVWASTTSGEKEMSFTLVPSDFPTSYPTSATTKQVVATATDGCGATTNVALSFVNVMLQSSKIQIKNASGAGIWNTEALKDIEISVDGSNITYYRNSSLHPTGNGSTHTYFTITKNGSNTGTASSITVTFKANVNYHNEYATGCHFVVENTETLEITENSELTSLVVQDGGELTVADNKTLTLDNLTVEAGGKVSGEGNLEVNDFTIESQAGSSGQLIGTNVQVSGDIYMDIKFYTSANGTTLKGNEANQWYMISAPFAVNLNGGFLQTDGTPMVFGQDFDLFYYDGKKRAETGTTGWTRVSGQMPAGRACLIGFNAGQSTTIRLKAASNTISDPASISLASNESSVGETDQEKSSNSDWNGIANPRMRYTNVNKDVYVWDNEEGTDLKPGRKYTVFSSSQYSFVVGTPFFVQAAGENDAINFSTATHSGDYLRAPKREVNERIEYCVRITREGANDFADQMYVRASEEASATYERGHDMISWNGTSGKSALIWSENYGMRLAIEEAPLSNNTTSYVLGLYAPADGQYIISTPSERDDATLYLTKDGTIIWDLTMSPYEAELTKGQNNGYGLLLQAKAPSVATGVDNVEGMNVEGVNVQKVIINDQVYILRGGQMYDVTGKMVK